jgi:hypothetical protein
MENVGAEEAFAGEHRVNLASASGVRVTVQLLPVYARCRSSQTQKFSRP